MQDLVVQRPEGLYCPPGDFYIDPWRPVEQNAHSSAQPTWLDTHRVPRLGSGMNTVSMPVRWRFITDIGSSYW